MRENSFYVDTVRAFRDRRYLYKTLVKTNKTMQDEYEKQGLKIKAHEAKELVNLYESLQVNMKKTLKIKYNSKFFL